MYSIIDEKGAVYFPFSSLVAALDCGSSVSISSLFVARGDSKARKAPLAPDANMDDMDVQEAQVAHDIQDIQDIQGKYILCDCDICRL
jgi:hypothetical protein